MRISDWSSDGCSSDLCAIDYVLSRASDIVGNIQEQAISHWATLVSDADAVFDCEYSFDADKVAPYVTWGTSPDQAIPIDGAIPQPDALADDIANTSTLQALRYTGLSGGMSLHGVPVQHVFFGSCTNARIDRKSTRLNSSH